MSLLKRIKLACFIVKYIIFRKDENIMIAMVYMVLIDSGVITNWEEGVHPLRKKEVEEMMLNAGQEEKLKKIGWKPSI